MPLLACAQCDRRSDRLARGWEGHLAGVPEEGEKVEIVFFCPACVEREFGWRSTGRPWLDSTAWNDEADC